MGSILGLPQYDAPETATVCLIDPLIPYDNLSIRQIEALWKSFYEYANSFALTKVQWQKICVAVAVRFGESPAQMIKHADDLFDAYSEVAHKEVIDAMEILAVLILISDTHVENKIRLMFDAFDMSEDGTVDIDEFLISVKSTLFGLSKAIKHDGISGRRPDEQQMEDLAEDTFREIALLGSSAATIPNNASISCDQFVQHCQKDYSIKQLFDVFSNAEGDPADSDLEDEARPPERTDHQVAAMDPESTLDPFTALLDTGGDEFTAIKPWLGAIVAPSNPPQSNPNAPSIDLELEWVHGFAAQTMRNNLCYTKSNEIVYPAAAVGVVLNLTTKTQRHNLSHTDDIISFAMHPQQELVATGECGRTPKIIVWNSASLESLATLRGFHKRGVTLLTFHPDGTKLVSVGLDDDHSLALYESSDGWQTATLAMSCKGNRAKPLHCCFNPSSSTMEFVICGVKYMQFWTKNAKKLTAKKAILGKAGKIQPFLVAANFQSNWLIGTVKGDLYVFSGVNLTKKYQAHSKSLNALHVFEKGFVSGGKDACVLVWNKQYEQIAGPFNLSKCSFLFQPSIRSVMMHSSQTKILIGTKGSDILELDAKTGTPLTSEALSAGHFKDELWGLAIHPTRAEFCTVGDDKTLRIWDLEQHTLLRSCKLDASARAVAYSPDGNKLVVGLGARVGRGKQKKSGAHVVLNAMDLTKLSEGHDSKKWISDVKFSPDGKYCAIGGHDTNIVLYEVSPEFAKARKFKKHNSYITHFDFSRDSQYLQSTCGAYEYLFANVSTGKQITSASSLRDVEWKTWTSPLGWPVQGIWPPCADGTDINAVDRSRSGRYLATADDFGKLKIFYYPCIEKGSQAREFRGHASHVTNVRWTQADSHVLTLGGNDRCIFQWKHNQEGEEAQGSTKPKTRMKIREEESHEALEFDMDAGGDEFMAVKPWLGAIKAPSNALKANPTAPDLDLELEWVHGYAGQTCRNNVKFTKHDRIVYHAAAVGIVFDVGLKKQTYAEVHDDDIVSLAMHPDHEHIATAQLGKTPSIQIWKTTSANTVEHVQTLRGFHKRAVPCICFSDDGKYLASVGADDDHKLGIYHWHQNKLIASAKGERNKVLDLCYDAATQGWISCGVKHIKFWKVQGQNLSCKKAILGKKGKPQAFIVVRTFAAKTVVGTQRGQLYVFQGTQLTQALDAHKKSINALHSSASVLFSGGSDGRIIQWSPSLEQLNVIDTQNLRLQSSVSNAIQALALNPSSSKLVFGTKASEIYQCSLDCQDLVSITTGHCRDELWGMSFDPVQEEFCTVGDDKTVRVWDLQSYTMKQISQLNCMARACAYSPNGNVIAIGCGGRVGRGKQKLDGQLVIVDAKDVSKVLFTDRPSKQWISDIRFSPNGKYLAVGSHDNAIYIYEVEYSPPHFQLRKPKFAKHNSYITHFDFATDSQTLQSTCGAYELLFCNVNNTSQLVSASSCKDAPWASFTCPLGWPVQGIWPKCADGTDVNAVDRSRNGQWLATADDFGKVKVFRYPCVDAGSAAVEFTGHASHVTNIRWSLNDRYVVSLGGNDRCIFQWRNEALEATSGSTNPRDDDGLDQEQVTASVEFDFDAGGDEFMAIKPWLGAIVPPSNPPKDNPRAPDVDLQLEWVHGYQGQTTRNNVRYAKSGEIVYHVAALGIVFNRETSIQSYHRAHVDDIISLDICSKGEYVVTGERGKSPKACVWDASSAEPLCELIGFHKRGIVNVAFSLDRATICTIGDDDDHSLAIWKDTTGAWRNGTILASCKGDRAKPLFVASLEASSSYQWITGGVKYVKFWSVQGSKMKAKKGQFGKLGKLQPILGACSGEGSIVTGAANGDLYLWSGPAIAKAVKAHAKSVDAISMSASKVLSGGKDGKVCIWSATLDPIASFELQASTFHKGIRSVAFNIDQTKIVVGTISSEIYELESKTGAIIGEGAVTHGHFRHELWGLAMNPINSTVCTVGDDKTLRIWDIDAKRMTKSTELPSKSRCCAYSPDGKWIALGLGGDVGRGKQKLDGAIRILKESDLSVLFADRPSKEWISDVKVSRDGQMLAFGSHDNRIYTYKVELSTLVFTKQSQFQKHNSYITHLDFSHDNQVLQSNCGAYELLFSDPQTGRQLTSASALKDTNWATWTCPLGWPAQGIWPECADGTDINAVCASASRQVLATADDLGLIKLFRYPCTSKRAEFVVGKGHSSHVTNVRFTPDDRLCFTTGGNDRGLFQWRLHPTSN